MEATWWVGGWVGGRGGGGVNTREASRLRGLSQTQVRWKLLVDCIQVESVAQSRAANCCVSQPLHPQKGNGPRAAPAHPATHLHERLLDAHLLGGAGDVHRNVVPHLHVHEQACHVRMCAGAGPEIRDESGEAQHTAGPACSCRLAADSQVSSAHTLSLPPNHATPACTVRASPA